MVLFIKSTKEKKDLTIIDVNKDLTQAQKDKGVGCGNTSCTRQLESKFRIKGYWCCSAFCKNRTNVPYAIELAMKANLIEHYWWEDGKGLNLI